MTEEVSVLVYLAGTAVLQALLGWMYRDQRPARAQRVGTVACINVYPFKSGKPLQNVSQAQCTHSGLEVGGVRDRSWMVISREKSQIISGRSKPKLVTIKTSIRGNHLHLDCQGHPTLKLPLRHDEIAASKVVEFSMWTKPCGGLDCGDAAAAWVDSVLGDGSGYKLIRHGPGLPIRRSNELGKVPLFGRFRISYLNAKQEDQLQYQDSSPVSLLTDVSLDDLNSRLENHVTAANFRQSIEIASTCPAFDEDSWKELFIGSAKFTNLAPDERCKLITANPETGTFHPQGEPLATLKSYWAVFEENKPNPCFGRVLVVDRPGTISIGDPVYVLKE